MKPIPTDFTEYLTERLGLSESLVNEALGAWLREYEPISCLGSAPPSGAAPAPCTAEATEPDLARTG
jgi:hypothetical protein